MQLTNGQEEAIKVCTQRYKDGEPYTVIAGYAGSGKSTAVSYIINALNIDENKVAYATLTGKASMVLREKGCSNAMTLHKLLYIPEKIKDSNDVKFTPRTKLEEPYKLIVVDECSMVSKEIFNLLLSHKVHVIFLGDPFQLPAIGESVNLLDDPHVMLTEIVRQAQDSPIIRLSMAIRDGKPLSYGGTKEARIISKDKISPALLLGADIVLTGRNNTRRYLNDQIRRLKWGDKYQTEPINGDKLICLKNCWDITDKNSETPLINGMIGTISNIRTKDTKLLKPKLMANFTDEAGNTFDYKRFNIDYKLLTTGEPTVNNNNFRDFYKVQQPVPFDYGYSATVYKYQGSQANRVLIVDDGFPYDQTDHQKFLYTAITRTVDRCILVI